MSTTLKATEVAQENEEETKMDCVTRHSPKTSEKLNEAIDYTFGYSSFLFESLLTSERSFVISPLFSLNKLGAIVTVATDEARNEMTKTLFGVEDMNEQEEALMLSYMRRYADKVNSCEGSFLTTAAFLLVDKDTTVREELSESLVNYLDLQVRPVCFDENIGTVISEMVLEKTGIVAEFTMSISDVHKETKTLVVDFSYFSGVWQHPFRKNPLISQFYNSDCTVSEVSYLNAVGTFEKGYNESYDCEVLRIPYKGRDLWLNLFVPVKGNLPSSFFNPSSNEWSADISALLAATEMHSCAMDLWMPEFSLEAKVALKKHLQAFGIEEIFNEETGPLEIPGEGEIAEHHSLQDIVQASIFEVRESLSEEDDVEDPPKSVNYQQVGTFICNCPFAFVVTFVEEGKTIVLYHGAVHKLETEP